MGGHTLAYSFGHDEGLLGVGVGHEDDERITAVAGAVAMVVRRRR